MKSDSSKAGSASSSAKSKIEWQVRGWKVRFKKQDEPGITARLFRAPRGAVLVEHGGHCMTRVREITFGGEEPRRSEAIGQRLQKAEPTGKEIAVLVENALRFFDPISFNSSDAIGVNRLASDLCVSPSGERCYVGSARFTQVVDRTRGPIAELNGVSLPRIVLGMDAEGIAKNAELWVHPAESTLRLVQFSDDGRPEVVHTAEVTGLSDLEFFLRVEKGDSVLALGKQKALDAMPFPGGPIDRGLERIGLSSTGVELHASVAHTHVLELLGIDANGLVVALDAPGKTHVLLLDQMTFKPRASRAFPKNGMYTPATLVSSSSVLALRRWEKLDRVFVMEWGKNEPPAEVRIADAKTSEEA